MNILFAIMPLCIVFTFLFLGSRLLSLCVSRNMALLRRLGGIITHGNTLSLMSFCIVNDVLAALLNAWLFIARVALVSNSDKLQYPSCSETWFCESYVNADYLHYWEKSPRAILLLANPPVWVRFICYFDDLVLDKGDFVVSGCFIRVVRNDYFSCLFCEHVYINRSCCIFLYTYQTLCIAC